VAFALVCEHRKWPASARAVALRPLVHCGMVTDQTRSAHSCTVSRERHHRPPRRVDRSYTHHFHSRCHSLSPFLCRYPSCPLPLFISPSALRCPRDSHSSLTRVTAHPVCAAIPGTIRPPYISHLTCCLSPPIAEWRGFPPCPRSQLPPCPLCNSGSSLVSVSPTTARPLMQSQAPVQQ
jgi:hypothetical protein